MNDTISEQTTEIDSLKQNKGNCLSYILLNKFDLSCASY